ncbi:MAG: ATP-binding protein [Clostridia bacterium]|nr:ATP-binding protein [Clostridia bacterium]
MFYSEITKIIEAGLDRDKDKVKNYSILLAKKLMENGDEKASKRIETVLSRKNYGSAITDALIAPPVDQESRLGIVDIDYSPIAPDIILSDHVKKRLDDFENTVKIKDKLDELGMPFNMSLLLYGPPGCGKTSIANYIANKFELPLVTARLDTLISSLLGNTAKNLRRIFEFAEKQPCVLFLDEFDAIAKARDDRHELGELKRVVNSLLQNMDAYCSNGILIAATNHQELLDDAIWRRFQTVIDIPKPSCNEIDEMIRATASPLDLNGIRKKYYYTIVDQLEGFSYSEIQNLIQNVVKHKIIEDNMIATECDFLHEIISFKYHGNLTDSLLIKYLLECGIPQKTIADNLQISVRQVRNEISD